MTTNKQLTEAQERWGKIQELETQLNDKKKQIEAFYDSKIKEAEQQIKQAKYAINQDPRQVKALTENLDSLYDAKENALFDWQKEHDELVNNPDYKSAQKENRRDRRWNAQNSGYEKNADIVKNVAQNAVSNTADKTNLSPTFYRDVAAAFSGNKIGNVNNDIAEGFKQQASDYKNAAANRQAEAQRAEQIAGRNEYTEAGKVASIQNDAQNRQSIANTEGLSGSVAARMRQNNAPDVSAERQRIDQQRMVANQQRTAADNAQITSTNKTSFANQYAHEARQMDQDTDDAYAYEMGREGADASTSGTDSAQPSDQGTDTQDNTTQDTNTQDTNTQDTSKQGTDTQDNKPAEPTMEQRPADSVSQAAQNVTTQNTGTQNVTTQNTGTQNSDYASFLAASNTGTAPAAGTVYKSSSNGYNENTFNDIVKTAIEKFPFTNMDNDADKQNKVSKRISYVKQELEKLSDWGTMDENRKNTILKSVPEKVSSDRRLKDFKTMLASHKKAMSDHRMKWIKHDFEEYGKPDEEDFAWLMQQLAGQDNAADYGVGYDGDDNTVLKGYANNIRNYVYNYKPEAMAISPDNDPNVTHIGPMAQDIEKVNPACISKDENGIESVDTGRVAMMNAGAIGDLARSLEDIKARLTRLEEQNGR